MASPAVFINYRTGDGEHLAELVYDRLSAAFGPGQVFLDHRSIAPAANYPRALRDGLRGCAVLLALIGPHWLRLQRERAVAGTPDWTNWEIAEALTRAIPVLPVLREGTAWPAPADLPGEVADLALCQYRGYDPRRSDQDLEQIVRAVRQLVPQLRAQHREPPPASKYHITVGRDSHIYEGPVHYVRERD